MSVSDLFQLCISRRLHNNGVFISWFKLVPIFCCSSPRTILETLPSFWNNRGSYYLSAGSQRNLSLAALFPIQGSASFSVCMYVPHGPLVYVPRPTLNRRPGAKCTHCSTSISDQFQKYLVHHVCFFLQLSTVRSFRDCEFS